jgi:hypothetical protein
VKDKIIVGHAVFNDLAVSGSSSISKVVGWTPFQSARHALALPTPPRISNTVPHVRVDGVAMVRCRDRVISELLSDDAPQECELLLLLVLHPVLPPIPFPCSTLSEGSFLRITAYASRLSPVSTSMLAPADPSQSSIATPTNPSATQPSTTPFVACQQSTSSVKGSIHHSRGFVKRF